MGVFLFIVVLSIKKQTILEEESYIWGLMSKGLTGNLTPEEHLELEELLDENPEWQQAYVYLKKINIHVEAAIPLLESEEETRREKAYEKLEEQLDATSDVALERKQKGNKKRRIRWMAVAAGIFVLLGLVGFFIYQSAPNEGAETYVTTNPGEGVYEASSVTAVILEDGTKVWLNQGSVLECDDHFDKENRKVMLRGEAFFDVAQNADHPFIVQLKSGVHVTVLGTRFNVKAYPNSPIMETSLLSGKIALSLNESEGDPIILKPNEKARINLDHLKKTVSVNKSLHKKEVQIHALKKNPVDHKLSETAWMENRLSFNNISFGDLGYELERRFGKKITFKDKKLKEYHLTGSFEKKSLQQILEALKITTPFQYKIEGEQVLLYSKD